MNGKRSLMIKLLLITIMVLQPVGAAFSMTMMSHHMSSASDMGKHIGMMDHGDRQTADGLGAHLDHSDISTEADDCCMSTAACLMASCGAVLFSNTVSIPKVEKVSIYSSIDLSLVGISVPTELRPPRNLIG
jgi:hypothetical protein